MIGALGSMLLFLAATAAGAASSTHSTSSAPPPIPACSTSLRSPPFSRRSAAGGSGHEDRRSPLLRDQGACPLTFLLLGGVLLGATGVIWFVDTPDVLLASADDSLGDAMIVLSMIGSIVVLLGVLGALGASPWPTSSRARPTTTHGADTPSSGHRHAATRRQLRRAARPGPLEAPLLDETPGDEEGS